VVRLLVRTAVLLLANAIGLIVAAAILDGMTLNVSGFIIALVIFTVAVALLQPFFVSSMRRRGANAAALGGVALIATFVALLVTDLVSDGLDIEGIGTWIAATVIVWAAALLAAFILPFLGLRKYLEDRDR
jgi:putative membrane protein